MKTKLIALSAAFSLACFGSAAMAGITSATYTPYDSITPSANIPTGDLVTLWGPAAHPTSGESISSAVSGGDLTLAPGFSFTPGSTALVVQNSYGYSAAPAMPLTGVRDTAPYLSILGSQTATLDTPAITELEVYIGSIDTYNTLKFNFVGGASESFGGADLAALAGNTGVPFGDQGAPKSNGLYTFSFTQSLSSIDFGSGTTNAFEIADIGVPGLGEQGTGTPFGPTPEPSTWALMLIGVFGAGGVLRSTRRGQVALAV